MIAPLLWWDLLKFSLHFMPCHLACTHTRCWCKTEHMPVCVWHQHSRHAKLLGPRSDQNQVRNRGIKFSTLFILLNQWARFSSYLIHKACFGVRPLVLFSYIVYSVQTMLFFPSWLQATQIRIFPEPKGLQHFICYMHYALVAVVSACPAETSVNLLFDFLKRWPFFFNLYWSNEMVTFWRREKKLE